MGIKQFSNPTSGYVNKFLRGINFDSTGTGPSAAPVSGPDGNSGISATGGQISEFTAPTGEVYKTHQFTTSGSFVISSVAPTGDGKIDFLVIGGGGAGASECSGGGGAGGYRTSLPEGPGGPSPTAETQLTLSAATYPIIIGAGGRGSGNTPNDGTGTYGTAGGVSTFTNALPGGTSITSEGGGGSIGYRGPNSVSYTHLRAHET